MSDYIYNPTPSELGKDSQVTHTTEVPYVTEEDTEIGELRYLGEKFIYEYETEEGTVIYTRTNPFEIENPPVTIGIIHVSPDQKEFEVWLGDMIRPDKFRTEQKHSSEYFHDAFEWMRKQLE